MRHMHLKTKTAGRIAVAALLGSVAFSQAAHADTIATLNFSNALSAGMNTIGGSISYSYDATDKVTAINSINIVATAYASDPGFTFTYQVPGTANNVNPAIILNDASNEVYALQLASTSDNHILYPEWTGVGTAAKLVLSSSFDAGFSSYGGASNSIAELASAGTSSGTVSNGALATDVPEPASMALLGLSVAGLAAYRRRSFTKAA